MKKAGIFTLTVILIIAMFSGCRRQTPDTTVTTTTKTTQTTTKATTPSSSTKAPSTTGVIPDATDLMPSGTDATSGTEMPRRHAGPRY